MREGVVWTHEGLSPKKGRVTNLNTCAHVTTGGAGGNVRARERKGDRDTRREAYSFANLTVKRREEGGGHTNTLLMVTLSVATTVNVRGEGVFMLLLMLLLLSLVLLLLVLLATVPLVKLLKRL
jgi:hypothetical protein